MSIRESESGLEWHSISESWFDLKKKNNSTGV